MLVCSEPVRQKGLCLTTIKKPHDGPVRGRFRGDDGDCIGPCMVYIYLYYANKQTDVCRTPSAPLNGPQRQNKSKADHYDYPRLTVPIYSCGAAFARLTYTRHFRIMIICTSSTVLLLYSIISRHSPLLMDCGVVLEPYIIREILQLQCEIQTFTLRDTECRSWGN